MSLEASNKLEKAIFFIMGFKDFKVPLSDTLPKEQLAIVSNYWLSKSNTSTVFSTILLSSCIVLFVETKNLWVCVPFLIACIFFAIRVWFCEKCASHALKLWT